MFIVDDLPYLRRCRLAYQLFQVAKQSKHCRLGFIVIPQKGSHIVLRKASQSCVVPIHRELKTGALAGFLKQAGVSVDEFISALCL